MRGFVLSAALAMAMPARAELSPPAELPPPDYAGQQYVDSKGCLFVRAGQRPDQMAWVPRVTREGQPLCGNPPSGLRVPVVGDGSDDAAQPAADTPDGADLPAAETADTDAAAVSGYFVAVGSFAIAANADAAVARLKALNYPVARGRMPDASEALITVFAGPFPDAERAARAQSELQGAGFPDATLMAP